MQDWNSADTLFRVVRPYIEGLLYRSEELLI
jgi:hypothetical protein